jgi:hypothetical protein
MVSHTTMDAESVKILKEFAIELMKYVFLLVLLLLQVLISVYIFIDSYMIQEKDRIFTKEYESTSTQYENLSRI